MILFDWRCPNCGAEFEEFEPDTADTKLTCPVCHTSDYATKLLSAPMLDPRLGVDRTGFPTMGDKWLRRRQQHQRIEERRKREHGA